MRIPSETAKFYDANAGPVYGYCLSLCADPEVAVNAFHRALIRAWSAGGGRVRAFSFVRAECRMRGLCTPTPAIDESDRDARALAPVFTRLPPRDAEAAELTLRFGLGATELAGVFGLPVEHAQRVVRAARSQFIEALTAESLVGVSEGVLSELVRSAHPLARVGGLMPPVEPPPEVREAVLANLVRLEPGECCAHRHGPGMLPYSGRTGPGPSRARRLVRGSAVLACSMLVAVGFVTGLSRPSGVESMWAPPSRPVADPPRLPPASVRPSSHKPMPHASPTAARPAGPVAAAHDASAPSRHATAPRPQRGWPYPGDRMSPRYAWGTDAASPYGDRQDRSRERLRAPGDGQYDGRDGGYDGRGGQYGGRGGAHGGPYGGYDGSFGRRDGPYDGPHGRQSGQHGGRQGGGRGGGAHGGGYGGGDFGGRGGGGFHR